jgi:repressor LexA
MRSTLTAKQRRFLDYLEAEIDRRGGAPSLREAAADLGISHAAVARHLKVLEGKGYVKRDGYYSRTVYLLNRTRQAAGSQRWREVPIVGRVAAGLPLYAQQEWDGSLVVDRSLFRGPVLFALRIRGDSMQGVGIRDRDLAICEPRQYARDGEIVVALINDEEATVKRFFLRPDHIELRAENPAYPAMRYGFDEVLVQGKVVGILRAPQEFD